jgi:HptB-dependent secretion and biofilm anti anti-sigma factor
MLQVSSRIQASTARLELSGRFDFTGRKALRDSYDAALTDPAVKILEVGLAGVEYIDSSALGMLLLMRERSQELGKKVLLCGAKGTVKQVLSVANFHRLFELVD